MTPSLPTGQSEHPDPFTVAWIAISGIALRNQAYPNGLTRNARRHTIPFVLNTCFFPDCFAGHSTVRLGSRTLSNWSHLNFSFLSSYYTYSTEYYLSIIINADSVLYFTRFALSILYRLPSDFDSTHCSLSTLSSPQQPVRPALSNSSIPSIAAALCNCLDPCDSDFPAALRPVRTVLP